MPNPIAYLMLLVWPLIAVAIYRRLPPMQATVWAILGAYMILPPVQATFDLPAVPNLDKFSIASLSALACTVWMLRARVPLLPKNPLGAALVILFVVSPFFTSATNPDPIEIVAGDVPALRLYDSIAYVSGQMIALIPFLLARRFLGSAEGMRVLVVALAVAGLVYSLPMIVEARLSPQLNVWVYGFFAHDFSQSMRGGGFRPMVFMPHGLWVAFFAMMAAMSALVILRHAPAARRHVWLAVALWLLATLVLCRSLGPMAYAVGLVPLILLAPRRVQLLAAACMAAVVVTYPALRGAHLVPLDDILSFARSISAERAVSLEYRILNEEVLLDRAQEKPWFGWGGYGRALILDPVTGRITSVADGGWIIVLGTYGWLGYVAQFGLLVLPLLLLGREAVWSRSAVFSPFGAAVALIYGANLIDLLPNNTLVPLTWLVAGALTGWSEQLAADRRAAALAAWKASLPQGPRTVL
jgi:hypothetical protein